ncbi:hypothetical protein ASPZODRAFT_136998 [Penicilliopsis zonata CBS 506.65]|uniref:Copper-fist domain-containing protein n=1 Tax=Penicilliopsis zonata CBS 506.65 TaxID=1073090 RepID=A0A1L9S6Q7_9EURO|nr:hypothetical protein ASPZODRAFT_136998 [Penicilliopsis zonata CBS 506.65]OJJ42854.1 hypothetical protein ASPZODRAFT_136998 [Penicilliopsis zonata CBS 506.65]
MAYLFILQGMLIDGQKWACEACVRGHRVTTCKHHDRPLIRIQRKGRPFSTCPVCNCTPCSSPEEHAKIRREADSKSSSKVTHDQRQMWQLRARDARKKKKKKNQD